MKTITPAGTKDAHADKIKTSVTELRNLYPSGTLAALAFGAGYLFLLFFLIAFFWFLPFPHLGFLGQANGFINWASVLIAVAGYYYFSRKPVILYCMILLVFIYSFLIVQMEQIDYYKDGGSMAIWFICLYIIVKTALGMLHNIRKKGSDSTISFGSALSEAPFWLFSFVMRRG